MIYVVQGTSLPRRSSDRRLRGSHSSTYDGKGGAGSIENSKLAAGKEIRGGGVSYERNEWHSWSAGDGRQPLLGNRC